MCATDGHEDVPAAAIGTLIVDEDMPNVAYCGECIDTIGSEFRVTEPLSWGVLSVLPRGKYVVVERDDGWHVYGKDDGSFS